MMMTKCKARFFSLLLSTALLLFSCGGSAGVLFCEKPSEDGAAGYGACGKKFTVGEIRVVVKRRGSLKTKKLLFKVFDLETPETLPDEIIEVDINEESNICYADFELYDVGEFKFVVETVEGKNIGDGVLTLVDE